MEKTGKKKLTQLYVNLVKVILDVLELFVHDRDVNILNRHFAGNRRKSGVKLKNVRRDIWREVEEEKDGSGEG